MNFFFHQRRAYRLIWPLEASTKLNDRGPIVSIFLASANPFSSFLQSLAYIYVFPCAQNLPPVLLSHFLPLNSFPFPLTFFFPLRIYIFVSVFILSLLPPAHNQMRAHTHGRSTHFLRYEISRHNPRASYDTQMSA